MSDKDDCVEMSEELTPIDDSEVLTDDACVKEQESLNDEIDGTACFEDNMGQLKSKLKKSHANSKNEDGIQREKIDVEITEPDEQFMCGVVEGFYGRPWTTGQRKELFRRMKTMGMNTYLYGPKDDYKHRLYWRDPYSEDEAELLKTLIESAAEHDVLFIYAISPGLDMSFASAKEIDCLHNKLLQVQGLGCKAFALLFDDIDPLLCAADKLQYASAASAQAAVTNQMYAAMAQVRFLFCPTEYCNSMAIPDVPNSKYLETIGKELDQNISVMWTGPKVVSKYITVESIKELTQVLRRKVVIWDNIHANDYDPKRMFLGPYKGRSTDLIPHLQGVLTNPNCELESNFIAMHTLATWWKSYTGHKATVQDNYLVEVEMDDPESNKGRSQSIVMAGDATSQNAESSKTTASQPYPAEPEVPIPGVLEVNPSKAKADKEKESTTTRLPTGLSQSCQEARDSSPTSSIGVSEDSETDSDYSSHDGRFASAKQPFDHGLYDPDEALREAVRSWLPYFAASSLPHGKPIARSGPPLAMLSQSGVVSNATITSSSSTTSVLRGDPIVSTSAASESESVVCEPNPVPDALDDVEMDGLSSSKGDADDMKMPLDCESERDEEKGDAAEDADSASDVTKPMETEEAMQCEIEPDHSSQTCSVMKPENASSRADLSALPDTPVDTVRSCEMEEDSDKRIDVTEKNESSECVSSTSSITSVDSMTVEDIQLAVELFYLPYEHGKFGLTMVHEFIWLRNNVQKAVVPPNAPTSSKTESMDKAVQWMEGAIRFEDYCATIRKVCTKLLTSTNRALLYDLFPYFWDMKGVVSMLSSYVKWMGQFYLRHQPAIPLNQPETESSTSKMGTPSSISVAVPNAPPVPPAAVWLGTDPEPWVFRGGLSGEFQRLLPLSMANDLFCQAIPCIPPTSSDVYTIRPYLPTDEKSVYNICLTTGNDGTDFADDFSGFEDLPGERLVGGLLTLSPEYCFVVEDRNGICGYSVGTANAKSFWRKYEIAILPEIKSKYQKTDDKDEAIHGEDVKRFLSEIRSDEAPDSYAVDNLYASHPALMQIAVHRRVTDPTIASNMTVCMLSALKSHNVHGVHTTVRQSDCFMPDQYCRLGFREIRPIGISPPSSPRTCSLSKEDTIIVFGRNF